MSGTPDLTLLFGNPALIEDCSFHPCVRYNRYENERVVSFVPPDGTFQLMTYRVVDRVPNMPVYCRPTLTWRDSSARASFLLATKPLGRKSAMGSGGVTRNSTGGISGGGGAMSGGGGGGGAGAAVEGPAIEEIVLNIAFPSCVRTVDLTSDVGVVTIDPSTNVRRGGPTHPGLLLFSPSPPP
jgi:AP-3 complex subunit mu